MSERDYSKEFTEESFWQKIASTANTLGRETIENLLLMYYVFMDKDTPVWAKTTLVVALGYFICPLDVISDFIPGVGYGDDSGVIAIALAIVAEYIKPVHREMAKNKVKEWFS